MSRELLYLSGFSKEKIAGKILLHCSLVSSMNSGHSFNANSLNIL